MKHSAAARHFVAVFAVLIAWGLKLAINPLVPQGHAPFLIFFAAVMVSAWYGGMVPGLVSVVLSAAIAYFRFLPPEYRLVIFPSPGTLVGAPVMLGTASHHYLRLGMFLSEGVLISILCGALHRARSQAEESTGLAEDAYRRSQQTIHDLTAAQDAAEAANRAKGEFLANISHELRTPMNAIIGMTDLVLDEELSPRVRDHLTTARESADVLLRLLNDVLDYSRLESGQIEFDSKPFCVRDTLDASIATFAARAREKGLRLRRDLPPEVPDRLVGDPLRLRQVLTNLIGNAIKFTGAGEVAVEAAVEARNGGEACLRFTVADTGIGISAEDRQKIFAPFTQVDASTRRQYSGSGLGLAICQELVAKMGGRIWVESRVGQGSRFHFTSRFAVQQEPVTEPDVARRPLGRAPHGGVPARIRPLRVLLAEDTPANQKVVVALLQKRGHVVEIAPTGRDAVDLFGRRPFDVVLMDVQMPRMDGFQAAQAIRQLEQQSQAPRVPIVALTAHAMRGDREKCLAAGMDAYLAKPIDAPQMLELLETLAGPSAPLAAAGGSLSLDSPVTLLTMSGQAMQSHDGTVEPGAEPLFDRDAALRRLGGDESIFREMARFFAEDSPGLLGRIRQGLGSDDAEEVTLAAHSLKGLTSNFSAPAAMAAARRLEDLGRSGDLHAARATVAELEREVARLNEALQPYCKG